LKDGLGNDILYGGDGDDELFASFGVDRLYGGAGNDLFKIQQYGTALISDTAGQFDELKFEAVNYDNLGAHVSGNDLWIADKSDIENQYASGEVVSDNGTIGGAWIYDFFAAGVDTIELIFDETVNITRSMDFFLLSNGFTIGTVLEETLVGASGSDKLIGLGGNDILRGFDGDDLLEGGDGDDTLFGGNGEDIVQGGDGNDTLSGNAGDDLIYGGAGDDILVGGSGQDRLFGGDGNDVLRGEGGNDYLNGGDGDDDLYGTSGEDEIYGGEGDDFLDGSFQSDLLYGGSGNDVIDGGEGYDELSGDEGDDILDGGKGIDILEGGLGIDTLTGGTQFDTFVFSVASHSIFGAADVILDFTGAGSTAGDTIDLTGIDANTLTTTDDAFTFHGQLLRADAIALGAGTLWVEETGTQTRLYGLINDDSVIDFEVKINDGASVSGIDYTVDDFLL